MPFAHSLQRLPRLKVAVRTVAVIGTLDAKGTEVAFLAEQIRARGCDTLVIDTGVFEPAGVAPVLFFRYREGSTNASPWSCAATTAAR